MDIKCAVHVSTIISMLPLTLITHNICNWHGDCAQAPKRSEVVVAIPFRFLYVLAMQHSCFETLMN